MQHVSRYFEAVVIKWIEYLSFLIVKELWWDAPIGLHLHGAK